MAHALNKLHHDEWKPEKWKTLLASEEVYRRTVAGDDASEILKSLEADTESFRQQKKEFEFYH